MLASRLLSRLARLGTAAPGCRGAFFSTQVVVPPLGDSISEGSISAVLKQAGDKVQENDVIAQIETDKVTIDIKAPRDGTLLGILVKVDETVIPGQLIATVDDAAAAAAFGAPATPQQQPEAAAPAAAAAAPAGAAAAAAPAEAAAAPERQPGIKFPPRVTPDGQRISALSAAEAASWLQRLTGGAAPHAAAPAAAAPAAAAVAAAVHPPQLPVSPAAAAVGKTARAKAVTTRLKEQPARIRMTDKELEAIMLGGAID